MTDHTYLDALRQAKIDLAHAIEQRDELSLKIVRLQQLVKALGGAADSTSETFESVAARIGFTETVLTVLRNSKDELTARNIRDRLVELGYELGKYANPLGFVHSVLNRLMAQGKIRQSAPGCFVAIGPTPDEIHQQKLKAIEAFPKTVQRRKK